MQNAVPLRGIDSPPVPSGADAPVGENIRLFLMTFVAGFVGFYALIA